MPTLCCPQVLCWERWGWGWGGLTWVGFQVTTKATLSLPWTGQGREILMKGQEEITHQWLHEQPGGRNRTDLCSRTRKMENVRSGLFLLFPVAPVLCLSLTLTPCSVMLPCSAVFWGHHCSSLGCGWWNQMQLLSCVTVLNVCTRPWVMCQLHSWSRDTEENWLCWGVKGWKENKWTIFLCSRACSPSEHDSTTPRQLFITSLPWAQFVEVEEEELNCQLKYVQLLVTVFYSFSVILSVLWIEIWDLEVRKHHFTLLLTGIIKRGNNVLYIAVQALAMKTDIKDLPQVNFVAFPASSWLYAVDTWDRLWSTEWGRNGPDEDWLYQGWTSSV